MITGNGGLEKAPFRRGHLSTALNAERETAMEDLEEGCFRPKKLAHAEALGGLCWQVGIG